MHKVFASFLRYKWDFIFTKDVIFSSESNAASLVLGFPANGNTAWFPDVPEE